MWEELSEIGNSVQDPNLKMLIDKAFSDPDLRKKILNLPGGLKYHHNYVGGLIEHLVSVAKICDALCNLYPDMDRDLLITGAILHDLGKTREYALKGTVFEYCPDANYFGHITLCEEEISKLIASIQGFPIDYSNELRHMILSHHGTKEMGSVTEPGFMEAEALHLADLSDSRLNGFGIETEGFAEQEKGTYRKNLRRRIIRGKKKRDRLNRLKNKNIHWRQG